MDWLRLFALLIAVASVQISAEGAKKKIRIHLPQKVKHIHHHKKIYITNHPASSQYAPAYLPSADGAVAVPTNIGLPAVASIVPLNSVEQLYDEAPALIPGNSPSASKLLPLYRARGYYGPTPSEWDDQDYDLNPPPESTDNADYSAPSAGGPPTVSNHPPKRVKIIKYNETPRKKPIRKQKPKRAQRPRPRPEQEDEHPVTSFHEQFYSDVDGSSTIRKIRKPQRVEKIVDGDTEHIHTYSEEHIHKVVFDDGPKLTGVVGVDPVGSMSALSASRPLLSGQALLAIPPETLTGFATLGSLGTPSHLEYSAYNPRDVTHDHIFHDHGELPLDVDITKDALSLPPKISYNSQGLRISGNGGAKKRLKNKYAKPTKPTPVGDFTYYESIYSPYNGLKKLQKPKATHYDSPSESTLNDYRPIPSFKLLGGKKKPRSYAHSSSDFKLQQASAPSPFSVSSSIVHDYQPKAFPGALSPNGFSKFKDPFSSSYANNFEYDTFASSSNIHTSEDKRDNQIFPVQGKKGKKQSVSTQNISFGGQGHQTVVDHVEETAVSSELNDDGAPSALDNFSSFDDSLSPEPVTSTPYTIKESSPVHQYYSAMAAKALQSQPASMPEASNDNFQYAEAPTPSATTSISPSQTTTTQTPHHFFELQNMNTGSTEPTDDEMEQEQRQRHKVNKKSNKINLEREHRQRYTVLMDYKGDGRPTFSYQAHQLQDHGPESSARGPLKYGDKI